VPTYPVALMDRVPFLAWPGPAGGPCQHNRHLELFVARPSSSKPAIADPACYRSGLAFSQIAPGDLDIAVIGQLAATNLALCDEFEPGPIYRHESSNPLAPLIFSVVTLMFIHAR